jgi:hypothetical protein
MFGQCIKLAGVLVIAAAVTLLTPASGKTQDYRSYHHGYRSGYHGRVNPDDGRYRSAEYYTRQRTYDWYRQTYPETYPRVYPAEARGYHGWNDPLGRHRYYAPIYP